MDIRKRLRAFTLIELLIVITIIGILAVALVPRITGGPAKARDAARKADLNQIATALEFYADDNSGAYPDLASGAGDCVADLPLSSYLTTMPDDPQGNEVGACGSGYAYYPVNENAAGDFNGYLLVADLENDDATGDGIYDLATLTVDNTDNTASAATNMGGMYLCTNASADCASNGAMYVVGR